MTDQIGIAYGCSLILGGLFGCFRGSKMSLLFGLLFGAWSVHNATHPTRQNFVANFAMASILGFYMLLRFLMKGRSIPVLLIIILSGVQVFRNYPYIK